MNANHHKNYIFSTQYFGGIELYAVLSNTKACRIERFENYQKRSLRNRTHILGPNGIEVLSVPLSKGKNAQTLITDVHISYEENWPRQHIQSIQSYYGKSPFLNFYLPSISSILLQEHKTLWELNNALCTFFMEKLEIQTPLALTDNFELEISPDYRDSSSVEYLNMRNALLKPMHYNQVFEEKLGYTPHLSILDLLFCCGPESIFKLNQLDLT